MCCVPSSSGHRTAWLLGVTNEFIFFIWGGVQENKCQARESREFCIPGKRVTVEMFHLILYAVYSSIAEDAAYGKM